MRYFYILILLGSCQLNNSLINKHVDIKIYSYQDSNVIKATAMPELKPESKLQPFAIRFDYLLINISEIHQPSKFEKRNKIWSLYPDTIKLKRKYLKEFIHDNKLSSYFTKTYNAIEQNQSSKKVDYSTEELMEVASKFFYCDKVFPDTTIEAHVCVGLNGVKEAQWTKDYTLLEAFCYEAIFHDLDKDSSQIWESFGDIKSQSESYFQKDMQSLESYLENVKNEVFKRMKTDSLLKNNFLDYYDKNQSNLAFKIVN